MSSTELRDASYWCVLGGIVGFLTAEVWIAVARFSGDDLILSGLLVILTTVVLFALYGTREYPQCLLPVVGGAHVGIFAASEIASYWEVFNSYSAEMLLAACLSSLGACVSLPLGKYCGKPGAE